MRVSRRVMLILVCLTLLAGAYGQDAAEGDGNSQPSLGDLAKALRDKRKPNVEVTQRDAKELFGSLNEILTFASQASGLPKRATVKYQLIGKDEADRHFNEDLRDGAQTQRLLRTELVLKKFGMLPQDFDLKKTLMQAGASGLAGYYDSRTKTMNLLNWIDLDQQKPVMAHELTHALQDQNYNLMTWKTAGAPLDRKPRLQIDGNEVNEVEARIAAVEGQATVVYVDYLLKPYGHSLGDSAEALDRLKNRIMNSYDSPVVVHNAPLVLKETTLFPYIDGLSFEIELLKRGGRRLAFAGAFARPPRDTHEIMEPDAYLSRRRSAPLTIPDLSSALGNGYQPYDSGIVGELDVRIMAEQFGRENDPYFLAPNWDGGAYIAVKKAEPGNKPAAELSTADLGLVYVSRWKSREAAERFAELYKGALVKRSKVLNEEAVKSVSCPEQPAGCSPVWSAHLNTEQGRVAMEIWPGNVLLITQGLENQSIERVRNTVLDPGAGVKQASLTPQELSLRLMQFPAIQALQERVLQQLQGFAERQATSRRQLAAATGGR